MIGCTNSAGGNFDVIFKCVADFIGCSIGGCLNGGGGGGGGGGDELPPPLPMHDEALNDETADKLMKALQPVTSLVSKSKCLSMVLFLCLYFGC